MVSAMLHESINWQSHVKLPGKRITAEAALEHPWMSGGIASEKVLKVQENLRSWRARMRFKKVRVHPSMAARFKKGVHPSMAARMRRWMDVREAGARVCASRNHSEPINRKSSTGKSYILNPKPYRPRLQAIIATVATTRLHAIMRRAAARPDVKHEPSDLED
jgi:hypothetical protein